MNHKKIAKAFDEWQREYERDPDGFGNGMQASRDHKKRAKGVSEYGSTCASLLLDLMKHGRKAWKRRAA